MTSMTPRGTPTPLTRHEVVRAALSLIDDEGLDALSMRRLGSRLGVDAMAIYRRVDNQEALFDAVAAEVFADLDVDALPWSAPWPELLYAYGVALRDVLLGHPHALPIYSTRPVRSPSAARWAMRGLLKMADEGVPSATALQVGLCVNEYVIGHALAMTADDSASGSSPPAESAAYGVLAAAAAAVPPGAHFELGLGALIGGLRTAVSAAPRPD